MYSYILFCAFKHYFMIIRALLLPVISDLTVKRYSFMYKETFFKELMWPINTHDFVPEGHFKWIETAEKTPDIFSVPTLENWARVRDQINFNVIRNLIYRNQMSLHSDRFFNIFWKCNRNAYIQICYSKIVNVIFPMMINQNHEPLKILWSW